MEIILWKGKRVGILVNELNNDFIEKLMIKIEELFNSGRKNPKWHQNIFEEYDRYIFYANCRSKDLYDSLMFIINQLVSELGLNLKCDEERDGNHFNCDWK